MQVHTSDPAAQTIQLRISGSVKQIVSIEPRAVRLSGQSGGEIKQVVTVIPAENYPMNITNIVVKNGQFMEASLQPLDAEKGQWQVMVTNTRKTPGRYFDLISLETDNPLQPELRINVFGNIE